MVRGLILICTIALSLCLRFGSTNAVIQKRTLLSNGSIFSKLSSFSGWITRRHNKYDYASQKKPSKAKYLPTSSTVRIAREKKAQYQRWYQSYYKEQQQWCGIPEVPINFGKKTKTFEDAPFKSWPWMVSLYQLDSYVGTLIGLLPKQQRIPGYPPGGNEHGCGGTLLSSEFVLTAAHCLQYWTLPGGVDELQTKLVLNCVTNQEANGVVITEKVWNECAVKVLLAPEQNFPSQLNSTGFALNTTELWEIWLASHNKPPKIDPLKEAGLMTRGVKRIKHYEGSETLQGLDSKGFHEDLAIIQLDSPIEQFTEAVRPICLTEKFNSYYLNKDMYHSCAVAGFGDTLDTYSQDQLQHAPYKLKSNKFCRQNTKTYPLFQNSKTLDTDQAFCAVENESDKTKKEGVKTKVCAGDSGGPMICKYKDGRWYQVGITSHGKDALTPDGVSCEAKNAPDVFTKVPAFNEWILKTMFELSQADNNLQSMGIKLTTMYPKFRNVFG